ncbi:MAG: hypothetical protein WC868_01895 [Bacteroidales bacterium]
MKIRFLFIIPFLLILSFSSKSQTLKKFSEEPQIFFEELTAFFKNIDNSNDKKTAKEFMELFTIEWNGNKFSADETKEMISTCNLMLKRKMKPIPHFRNYLSTIVSFNNTNQSDNSFKAWEASLTKLINRSTSSQFIDYLEISNSLFTENVLYKSSTTKWKSDNSNYIFEFDTVPRIVFPSLNLSCYANDDSANIYNTKGVYYPTLSKWVGSGGKVLWKRAGFDENTIYAELDKYVINVTNSKYTADSVKFFYKDFFDKPLLGKLDEKIMANMNEDKATYPRFDSYNKRLKIESIFPNIDYDGGFTMHGGKLIGSGDNEQDAYLIFYREGQKFIKTGTKTYTIRKNKISSDRASITIYWEKDSIYHPGLQMKYLNDDKELSLLRSKEGIAETPFFDTYHKLDLYFEALYWKMDQPLIEMKMIKGVGTESEAAFESYNYFTAHRYYKLQGIDESHPLNDLKKYAKSTNSDIVSVPAYANYLKIALSQIEALMLNLANMGFIAYDIVNNKVYLKEKLYNFLLAKAGKVDSDVLQFNSITKEGKTNATLNLLNFDLEMNGVNCVYLSDSQNVYIFPKDKQLIIKKDRDFDFDGRIHAGMFDFYGKLFSFTYNKFKIDMPVVDSMAFFVKSFKVDENGNRSIVKVKSVLEGIKGDLQIDAPNNKSGIVTYGQYPLFRSIKDSYVYYDKKAIQKGVYTKDRFYFHVDPFEIDSLDNKSTEGIGFSGDFVSADIFPDFEEVLKVQDDYSLGFVRLTPESGFAVYKGKGTYDSIVDMSNGGLKGNGTLKYLTSVSKSNNIIFYPDSLNAEVQLFTINEQKAAIEYPPVIAEDVYEHWMPYQDIMNIYEKQKPLAMYNSEAKLHGSLALTPTTLTGRGTTVFSDAEMDAKLFKFKNRVFDSDTADFRLKSYDLSRLAFSTFNYNSHIDFDARKGEFKSNGGNSKVEFPINMYICYMDEFDWFMDEEEIELANNNINKNTERLNTLSPKELADIDISGSEFVSVHPDQDSLRFFSPRAKFNLKHNIITARDVKIIKVADAAIYPEKGNVTILEKAEMKPLENAQILANMATKYHVIYNALVNINGRKKYSASGMYDYVDEDSIRHPIYLDKIEVDTTLQTYGTGDISDTSKLILSSNFDFAGGVKLTASNEFLNFNGAFKIKYDCDTLPRAWIKFHSDINPKEIYIPINDTIRDVNNRKLEAGIFLANDSNDVYSAFLSKKLKSTDQDIITARGFIYYDKVNDEYRISNKEKIKQFNQPGNYVSLTKVSCITYGDGKIELAPNLGRVAMGIYGNAKHYIIPDSASLDLVMYIDFFFSDDALKQMVQNLEKLNTLKAVDLTRTTFTKALTEILGAKEADKLISDVSMNGAFKKIPSELSYTLFLGDVQMKWNSFTKSFISEGPIGIVALNKNQINKYVNGYVEVVKKKTVDEINVYLEFDSNNWYYFNYKSNVMQAISSSTEFNTAIKETKSDKRTLKSEKDLPQYSYTISTEMKKKTFLKKVEPSN